MAEIVALLDPFAIKKLIGLFDFALAFRGRFACVNSTSVSVEKLMESFNLERDPMIVKVFEVFPTSKLPDRISKTLIKQFEELISELVEF